MYGVIFILPSTPTLGLEIILDLPPLDLLVKEEARREAARISGRNPVRWDGIGRSNKRGHLFRSHKDWGQLDRIPKTYLWQRLQIDYDSFKTGILEEPKGSTICYTCLLYTSDAADE